MSTLRRWDLRPAFVACRRWGLGGLFAVLLSSILAPGHSSSPVVLSAARPGPLAPAAAPISDVRVANVTDTSFTVSWRSADAETGAVRFAPSPEQLAASPTEVTDAAGAARLHLVTVTTGVSAETTYYFHIVSGSTAYDNGGSPYTVTTGSAIPDAPLPPEQFIGLTFRLETTTGAPPAELLVALTLSRAGVISAPVVLRAAPTENGAIGGDPSTIRTADLTSYFGAVGTDMAMYEAVAVDAAGAVYTAAGSDLLSTLDASPPDIALPPAPTATPTMTATATSTATATRTSTPTPTATPIATATSAPAPGSETQSGAANGSAHSGGSAPAVAPLPLPPPTVGPAAAPVAAYPQVTSDTTTVTIHLAANGTRVLRKGVVPRVPDQWCGRTETYRDYVRLEDVGIAGATLGLDDDGRLVWIHPRDAGCVGDWPRVLSQFTFPKEVIMQFPLRAPPSGALLWVLDGDDSWRLRLYEVLADGKAHYIHGAYWASHQAHYRAVWKNLIPVSWRQLADFVARGLVGDDLR